MFFDSPLFWIDCEATGLHPDQGHLMLEIAFILTDSDLNEITSGLHLIQQDPDEALGLMNDYVKNMHTQSGLINQIGGGAPAAEVERSIIEQIRAHTDQQPVVAGNSLALDRNFMHAFMPELNDEVLHYRSIDVSSFKELARRWNPEAYSSAPEKSLTHRALDDIRESMTELQHYRDTFLRVDRSSSHRA